MPTPINLTTVENPMTKHLDATMENALSVLVQVRQLRHDAKSGRPLDGWAIRNLQADTRALHRKTSGL